MKDQQSSLISTLIPVYNSEKYLRRCLDSIVNQTYKNLQLVIVDDGSNDNSLAICKEYAERHDFIEIYHQENAGVAAARNALLDKAKGDYAIFIDSDDWIEPDMIEGLLHYIAEYDLDIAICGSTSEYNDNATAVDTSYRSPLIDNREEAVKKFLLHKELNGSLWNKLVKTSLFHNLRFAKDIWYGEDALMMWQVLQRVNRIGTVPTAYYHYRMNDASISHQAFGPRKMSGHQVWASIYADTCRDWPQYAELAKANFAVSDFWLLVYAAIDKYTEDSNIVLFRKNLKENIRLVYKHKLISLPKMYLAVCFIMNYEFSGKIMRMLLNK